MTFPNPTHEVLRSILQEARTIAVVGLSPNPDRDSYEVAAALQGWGYRVVPIRPAVKEVLGEKAWATLSDLPAELLASIDIIDVFRSPEHVDALVDECLALGLAGRTLWLQYGVVNESAAAKALAGGMTVVMDHCIKVDHRGLIGT